MKRAVMFVPILILMWAGLGLADSDPEPLPVTRGTLEVIDEAPDLPTVAVIRDPGSDAPYGDGGEALRGIAGVSLGRMGGHGLEAAIRGLAQGHVNVLLDGAYINGGCPNRMDPQTSFAATENFDEIVVIKGVQSLRYGPGGSAGTVLFNRRPAEASETLSWSGRFNASYGSFFDGPEVALETNLGWQKAGLRVMLSRRGMDNYEDGGGREVRSAFDGRAGVINFAWRPDARTVLDFDVEATDTDDALFAGAGMDAPVDEAMMYRFAFERREVVEGGVAWRANVYHSDVEHLMDNFSLRPLAAPMAMEVPTTSKTSGGRAFAEFGADWRFSIGVDVNTNRRDATRFAGPDPERVATVQSIMWPEVEIADFGFVGEVVGRLAERTTLRVGLRGDRFQASADAARHPTMGGNGPTPMQLWTVYYPEVDDEWDHDDVGALVRVEHQVEQLFLFAGVSRSVRAPDATERYLASNSSTTAKRWVGNPGLDATRHHQVDAGVAWQAERWTCSLTAFADDADDFILRDRARLQSGIRQADGATIYRNVDVRRYGAEAETSWRIGESLVLGATAAWVRAGNRTDDRPVAQIPPLEGTVHGRWSQGRWSAGAALRWADRQNRVDDDPMTGSGLDFGESAGWTVFDCSVGIDVGHGVSLEIGADNLFDRDYATHLNRSNLFDPDPVRVNEPGRAVWTRVRLKLGNRG